MVTLKVGASAFASAGVGSNIGVIATGLSLGGASAPNYQLSSVTAVTTASITPRTLTVAPTGVDKSYDGTTTAVVTLSDNRITGDSITDSYTDASFSDPSAGAGKTVSVTGISISGSSSGNYALSSTTATTTADITAASASIALSGLNQTFTGEPIEVTATTIPAGLSVTITYNGSVTTPAAAGVYAIVATIDDPNYSGTATGTLNIAQ